MSAQAVTDWLVQILEDSLQDPAGASFPYSAAYGILFAQDFTTSNVTVRKYRSPVNQNFATSAAIILNPVEENEDSENGQYEGPNYQSQHSYDIEILWRANFLGDTPLFTDENVSAQRFGLLVDRFKKSIRKSMFRLYGPSDERFFTQELTDPDTEETSILERRIQQMRTVKQAATLMGNGVDRFYGAMVTVTFLETL